MITITVVDEDQEPYTITIPSFILFTAENEKEPNTANNVYCNGSDSFFKSCGKQLSYILSGKHI